MQIVASNLSISYKSKKKGEIRVINKMNAIFPSSSFSLILGPSGCGKSTLLKALTGSIDYEGEILYDGSSLKELPQDKLGIAYVPQEIHLYPFLTIFDNIAFPLKIRKTPREELLKKVRDIALELDISPCLNVRPKYCSMGQRQRAMIARELVSEPKAVFFDEPLSSVDKRNRDEICHLLKKYQQEHKATFIYVTHSFSEATFLGDTIYIMEHGEFVAKGSPMHLINSGNPYLRSIEESEENEGE